MGYTLERFEHAHYGDWTFIYRLTNDVNTSYGNYYEYYPIQNVSYLILGSDKTDIIRMHASGTVSGGAGRDDLASYSNADLYGGMHNDTIAFYSGADNGEGYGELGEDTLISSGTNIYLNGGRHNDVLMAVGDAEDTRMEGEWGDDTLVGKIGSSETFIYNITGDAAADTKYYYTDEAKLGNDKILKFELENDKIEFTGFGSGVDSIDDLVIEEYGDAIRITVKPGLAIHSPYSIVFDQITIDLVDRVGNFSVSDLTNDHFIFG